MANSESVTNSGSEISSRQSIGTAAGAFPDPAYSVELKFNRLTPGVDNFRIDVFISPEFRRVTEILVRQTLARIAQAEEIFSIKNPRSAVKERDEFKRISAEVLQNGVHSAKAAAEIQIDFLGQAAVFKMLIESIREQYNELLKGYQRRILAGEQVLQRDIKETIRLKDRLSSVRENRSAIIRQTGMEIFGYLLEVHRELLKPLRIASLGPQFILPDEMFLNPLLHVTLPPEDDIMLEMYILLGRRFEDPDRYDAVRSLLSELIRKALSLEDCIIPVELTGLEVTAEACERILGCVDVMQKLFDAPSTENALRRFGAEGISDTVGEQTRSELSRLARDQDKRLHYLIRRLRREALMKRICAVYEVKSLCPDFCPPLQPMQILQFLTVRKSRRPIAERIKNYRKAYGKNVSIGPLRRKSWSLWRIPQSQQKKILVRFLLDFSRFHRDLLNSRLLFEAMDRIDLSTDKKRLALSRENKTLYEYPLSSERRPEERKIVRHVILKADVRGATDLTSRMIEMNLNPASFFSLNFFEPISSVLPGYGAEKVFIEGDAIILSIMERENEPSEWFAVSRACGLAVQIVMIVARYNTRSRENRLPVLEIGCGISYLETPPAFLFDGESRIMISPAINFADRMSGCTRALRAYKGMRLGPFNLRVLQTAGTERVSAGTRDDLCIRYNVNGIELNAAGFQKLEKEIRLKTLQYTAPGPKEIKAKLYTGKFPTASGQYQRLIVREAQVPEVVADSLKFVKWTERKYYEVCTHPDLYEFVRQNAGD